MHWESQRYETDRTTRDGEMVRDRRTMRHVRELEVARAAATHDEGAYVERGMRLLARAARAAASWMA